MPPPSPRPYHQVVFVPLKPPGQADGNVLKGIWSERRLAVWGPRSALHRGREGWAPRARPGRERGAVPLDYAADRGCPRRTYPHRLSSHYRGVRGGGLAPRPCHQVWGPSSGAGALGKSQIPVGLKFPRLHTGANTAPVSVVTRSGCCYDRNIFYYILYTILSLPHPVHAHWGLHYARILRDESPGPWPHPSGVQGRWSRPSRDSGVLGVWR